MLFGELCNISGTRFLRIW